MLKVSTHGMKLKRFSNVVMPPEVKTIVDECGILPLVEILLTMLYHQLLTTFIERSHKETSSFHLPFSEMTITLDDVSSFFHVLLAYSFFTAPFICQETARMTMVQYLGVIVMHVIDEFKFMSSAHFCLSWLWDRYDELVHRGMYEADTRVYMLHFVGCTILTYRSHVYIDVKYMWLFNSLEYYS